MGFGVKLDEDLPERLLAVLAGQDYDAVSVKSQGWQGLKDEVLWPRIVAEGRFFITADKGFGNARKFRPGTHPGILLLRVERESYLLYCALLSRVLGSHRLEGLAGCVAVASFGGIRVRRILPDKQ